MIRSRSRSNYDQEYEPQTSPEVCICLYQPLLVLPRSNASRSELLTRLQLAPSSWHEFHTGVTCEFGALRPVSTANENIPFYSILTVIITATPKPSLKVQAIQDELTTIDGNWGYLQELSVYSCQLLSILLSILCSKSNNSSHLAEDTSSSIAASKSVAFSIE